MAYTNYLYWIILLKYVQSQDVWDPNTPFIANDAEKDRVQFGEYVNQQQVIYMDENIEERITIVFLNYAGSEEPKISRFYEPSSGSNNALGATFEKGDTLWGLVVTMKQDYEGKDYERYAFDVTATEVTRRVYLYINNLDDESPIIEVLQNPCEIEENKVGVSGCYYTIRDADGVMNKEMHYTLAGPEGIEAIFEIKDVVELENGMKEWTAVLNTVTSLDYESTALYLLDFTVTDSGGNQGTTKIVINVLDMPDRPPVWRNIFSSQQFDEKTEQTFQVEAVDGDVVINYPINYKLISEAGWEALFSIEEASGIIKVNPIDRDTLKKQIFTFQVIAFEVPDPSSFIEQFVTIIVNDLNDNQPSIAVVPETVRIPENTATKLEFQIQIEDMDLGDNGTYDVSLRDSSGNDYNLAFQIVPDEGYQSSKFTISVLNSALLDYEEELWRTITVEIYAQEKGDISHIDAKTITIFLNNVNDEYPVFKEESYTVTVREDIGKDELIATVFATDRDENDVVKHSLIGNAINALFSIDEGTGEIRTRTENAFDYEKETEVIIQVQAEDSLDGIRNRVNAQLVIAVGDVNDEPPTITAPISSVNIDENQKHGAPVNVEITATDEDGTADLIFRIIWEESYATKNGQIVSKEYYESCIDVKTEENLDAGRVKAVLTINEITVDNTPDYEKMDKLYIVLEVEDQDQEIVPKTDKITITINIEDVNDNRPVFDEGSINSIKRVTERASANTPIATIIANDADGPEHNKIEYSISPFDDNIPGDWIAIDTVRGDLYVNADEKIDADGDIDAGRPPFLDLVYTVTALNGDFVTTAQVRINVIDINDNPPIITVFSEVVNIHEASPNNTDVQIIGVIDADRDEAYNTPWFRFGSSVGDEIKSFFSIESGTGRIYVHYKDINKVLDRDKGTPTFSIPIIIGDNYDLEGADSRQNIIDESFTVILLDINNRPPTINSEYENLYTSEEKIAGTDVGDIQATDDDEPGTDNTKINFSILTIEKGADAVKDPPEDLFSISTGSNDRNGWGTLTTRYALRDYYGTYNVLIKINDFGTYPEQLSTTPTIYVHVNKYNFVPPKIMYPANQEKIYLQKDQEIGRTLNKYDGQALDLFYAEDLQTEKWDIQFTIIDEASADDVFKMEPAGRSKSRLVLISTPNEITYTLKIIADCNCDGQSPFTDSVTIDIRFISEDSEPYFITTEVDAEFPENITGIDTKMQLPKAYFKEGEDWEQFKIYYELKEDPSGCFAVGAETGVLELIRMLDREDEPNHTLKVAASKNPTGNNNPHQNSVLTVFVKVLDVNDNPPNFENPLYYAGIKPSDDLGAVILTVSATDLDIDDSMTFSMIQESFTAEGTGIDTIQNPFVFKTETGNSYTIILNFSVQSNMNGYFLFDIKVTDAAQQSDTATVKIYVVSDSSRTAFKFENHIDDVEPKKNTVKEILEEEFSYIANIETVQMGTNEAGVPVDTETNVIMHFINSENNEPITSTEIEQMASDVEVFARLRSQFLKEGLYLLSFTDTPTPENMEEILRAWLIGISVALGLLCTILIIAFVVKTRSLMRRLNNLTEPKFGSQESGLNRMGLKAPNTNKYAEGSNPVYSEEKKMPDLDTASIGSGDSDLIGIEDNPNFQYVPGSNNAGEDEVVPYDHLIEVAHPEIKPFLVEMLKNCRDTPSGTQQCEKTYNFFACLHDADPEHFFMP